MTSSGPSSAPVANGGVLGLLEALDSYNFNYNCKRKLAWMFGRKSRRWSSHRPLLPGTRRSRLLASTWTSLRHWRPLAAPSPHSIAPAGKGFTRGWRSYGRRTIARTMASRWWQPSTWKWLQLAL